jgi:hypothetical protein
MPINLIYLSLTPHGSRKSGTGSEKVESRASRLLHRHESMPRVTHHPEKGTIQLRGYIIDHVESFIIFGHDSRCNLNNGAYALRLGG